MRSVLKFIHITTGILVVFFSCYTRSPSHFMTTWTIACSFLVWGSTFHLLFIFIKFSFCFCVWFAWVAHLLGSPQLAVYLWSFTVDVGTGGYNFSSVLPLLYYMFAILQHSGVLSTIPFVSSSSSSSLSYSFPPHPPSFLSPWSFWPTAVQIVLWSNWHGLILAAMLFQAQWLNLRQVTIATATTPSFSSCFGHFNHSGTYITSTLFLFQKG